MTEQAIVNWVRDWFPIGDPHFSTSECQDCWCDECRGCPNAGRESHVSLAGFDFLEYNMEEMVEIYWEIEATRRLYDRILNALDEAERALGNVSIQEAKEYFAKERKTL